MLEIEYLKLSPTFQAMTADEKSRCIAHFNAQEAGEIAPAGDSAEETEEAAQLPKSIREAFTTPAPEVDSPEVVRLLAAMFSDE